MAIKKVMILLQLDARPENGCDISYYQGIIDFKTMKKAGIKAVIIRAGYGTTIDKRFISYINAAIREGFAIGIYWFVYASNTADIVNNARKCLEVVAPYKQYISLGIWCDWEYDSDRYAGTMAASTRAMLVDTFNCYIEEAGYEAGIYSNQDYIQSRKFQPWLIEKYPLWFAKYSANISSHAYKGKNKRPYIWQYCSSGNGKTYGASSKNIDMNKVFVKLVPDATVPPVDKVTQNPKTINASDNPYPEPTRVIYYNTKKGFMHGDDVKWIQWHLWRFGLFLDGAGLPDASQIDGVWGQKSDSALAIAQKRLGLTTDRKCGRLTRAKFKEV